eukprot:g2642.t1
MLNTGVVLLLAISIKKQPGEETEWGSPQRLWHLRASDQNAGCAAPETRKAMAPAGDVRNECGLERLKLRVVGSGILGARVGRQAHATVVNCGAGRDSACNATDVLLWSRLAGPTLESVAVRADPSRCRWHLMYTPRRAGSYELEVVPLWVGAGAGAGLAAGVAAGAVGKHCPQLDGRVVRGEPLPRSLFRAYAGNWQDLRWTFCDKWCELHPHCDAWVNRGNYRQHPQVSNGACVLLRRSNGTRHATASEQAMGVASGACMHTRRPRASHRHLLKGERFVYVGGLSSFPLEEGPGTNASDAAGNSQHAQCRAHAHVGGSPFRVRVRGAGTSGAGDSRRRETVGAAVPPALCTWRAGARVAGGAWWRFDEAGAACGNRSAWVRAVLASSVAAHTQFEQSAAVARGAAPAVPLWPSWRWPARCGVAEMSTNRICDNCHLTLVPPPAGSYVWRGLQRYPALSGSTSATSSAAPQLCRFRFFTNASLARCLNRKGYQALVFGDSDSLLRPVLDAKFDANARFVLGSGLGNDSWGGRIVQTDLQPRRATAILREAVGGGAGAGASAGASAHGPIAVVVEAFNLLNRPGFRFREYVRALAHWPSQASLPHGSKFVFVTGVAFHHITSADLTLPHAMQLSRLAARELERAGWLVLDALEVTLPRPDFNPMYRTLESTACNMHENTMRNLLVFLGLVGALGSQKNKDRVTTMPGFDGPLPSAHYSGYLSVGGGTKMLHYYLQEADTSPASKPLLLWLNGGPGASSLIGAFTELGQLVFNANSSPKGTEAGGAVPTLFRNPSSWTTEANVLFLEAPAGVGFSYCVDPASKCVNNDTSTAADNYEALLAFVRRFPEYASRPKLLTGESYAGIYLPMLLDEISRRGVVRNVTGAAIGNGCWGTVGGTNCGDLLGEPGLVYRVDKEYFAGRGLVSPALAAAADAACGNWTDPLPAACEAAYTALSDAVGEFNIDNVDDACPGHGAAARTSLRSFRASGWRQRWLRRRPAAAAGAAAGAAGAAGAAVLGNVQMWCGASAASHAALASAAMQQALHVAAGAGRHPFDYEIQRLDLRPLYRRLASDAALNLVIYNGLSDANVPFNGQVRVWARGGAAAGQEWLPWSAGGRGAQTAGHVRRYSDTFKFVTVNGAGHEVPTYQPAAALAMLKQFVL